MASKPNQSTLTVTHVLVAAIGLLATFAGWAGTTLVKDFQGSVDQLEVSLEEERTRRQEEQLREQEKDAAMLKALQDLNTRVSVIEATMPED